MVFENKTGWSDPWESGYLGLDPSLIIGVAWNSAATSPTLTRIDVDGNTVTKADEAAWTTWFNAHPLFGQIWRCSLTAAGTAAFGSDAKGTGLTLTNDYIMSRIPLHYIKCDLTQTIKKWWISPFPWEGFVPAYAFNQRSHNLAPANQIYVGCYDAYNAAGSPQKLGSKSGAAPYVSATMATMETAANNIGTGWGIVNIHTWAMLRLLTYIRLGTFDTQSAVGPGYSNASNSGPLSSGTVSAKEDSMGRSSGTADTEGVTLFGLENLWGNIHQFIIGYNAVDAEHRIVKQDGTGTLAATLTSGNYDAVTSPIPLNGTTNISGTDLGSNCAGYISAFGHDTAGILDSLMIPSALVGSSTTYIPDKFYSHNSGISQTSFMIAGGLWSNGAEGGIGCAYSSGSTTDNYAFLGSRLEYIG